MPLDQAIDFEDTKESYVESESVGRLYVSLKKKRENWKWDRLIDAEAPKPKNMQLWWDMQAKHDKELDEKNINVSRPVVEGDDMPDFDDEDSEDQSGDENSGTAPKIPKKKKKKGKNKKESKKKRSQKQGDAEPVSEDSDPQTGGSEEASPAEGEPKEEL